MSFRRYTNTLKPKVIACFREHPTWGPRDVANHFGLSYGYCAVLNPNKPGRGGPRHVYKDGVPYTVEKVHTVISEWYTDATGCLTRVAQGVAA